MYQQSWIEGFICAAYLFSGKRVQYEEARDQYLMDKMCSKYDPNSGIAANE